LIGETISHYRIVDKLGEGGMGVVYKAEDTRLDRTVALKFLSAHLLEDEEARERFVREAKAAATLDHPNICTVYEIDEAEGQTFLAMAFIEGPTLQKKIDERPLKLKQALDIAIQIADGLAAAHQRDINHRDIKPANVMLTADGQAKIMDFGLAQLGGQTKITKSGMMLGTPSYMAPEQIRAEETDHRVDIWAFGVVLHEMIAGQPPFAAATDEGLGQAVLHLEPEPLTALRRGVPMELDRIAAKCLAKDPDERYQHIDETLVDLRALRKKLPETTRSAATTVAAAPAEAKEPRLPWLLFGLVSLVAGALAIVHFTETQPEAPLRRVSISPRATLRPDTRRYYNVLAISPDGRHVAFLGDGQLWVQDFDQEEARPMEGTEGARAPFWSPDNTRIGFFVGGNPGELRWISVNGGPSSKVCDAPEFHAHGASWSPDNELIVFASGPSGGQPASLYQVNAAGGTAEGLISWEELGHTIGWAHFLPAEAGARVLLIEGDGDMMLQDLDTGQRRTLGPGFFPVYSTSGHIIFQSAEDDGTLWARRFSLDTLEASGDLLPVAQNARHGSVARDGTLVYLDFVGPGDRQLVWVDRNGGRLGVVGATGGDLDNPALSPDGRSVAYSVRTDGQLDVWIYDMNRGIPTKLTTSLEGDTSPFWSREGDQIAFSSYQQTPVGVFFKNSDGTGTEMPLTPPPQAGIVTDWSRDGQFILYQTPGYTHYLSRSAGGGGWEPTQYNPGTQAKLSPNSRYVAYGSEREVYVGPFPEGGRRWQVSANGGGRPRWSRDGDELFYVDNEGTLVAVEVSTDGEFWAGTSDPLFQLQVPNAQYDVSLDGKQFLVVEPVENTEPLIRVVENWFAEFRDR